MVAYIGLKSRTERPGKTEIGTELAHVTCDTDTTFKVKGQGHWAALLTAACSLNASGSCSGVHGNVLGVGSYCYVAMCSTAVGASVPTEGGEGRRHIVAAARLQLVIISLIILTECGGGFTSKLEGMFKDMELSKDIMVNFRQVR